MVEKSKTVNFKKSFEQSFKKGLEKNFEDKNKKSVGVEEDFNIFKVD